MDSILNKFAGLNVLVVGDVMIDAYYFGKVNRISPEAPVPVVAVDSKENRLGGAANVAMNLVSLGAKPIVCSVIGTEKEGDDLVALFEANGVNTSGIIRSSNRVTTVKTRVIAQQTQMLRIDHEQTTPLSPEDSEALVKEIKELLKTASVLIFEDYDKGVLTQENIEAITTHAIANGVPVVVDPKKRNFNAYQNAFLFKPNLNELRDGLNKEIDPQDREAFEKAIAGFMQQMNIRNVMITMSERGVMITDGKQFDYIPAHFRKIADVSGAGDTVISVAALSVANKWDNRRIAEFSNLAGGLVCEEVGVVPIDKNKLQSEINRLQMEA